MAEEPKKTDPKISIVEIIVISQLLIIGEVADIAADLSVPVPGIGEITLVFSRLYGGILSSFIVPYLILRGVSPRFFIGGTFIGIVVPGGRSGAFIATIIEDRLPPKAKKLVSTATKATNPVGTK